MKKRDACPGALNPEFLVRAYGSGIFPMAEARDDPHIHWIDPEMRGIIPLDTFHVSKSLKKTLRRETFEIRADTAFERVILACATAGEGRRETWINDVIIDAFIGLHELGLAHSIESWRDEIGRAHV